MRKLFWLGGLVVWLGVAASVQAKLTIYFLRHAEAGHNVVKVFVQSGIPTNQWPAYVGNGNMFTPDGEAQVRGVTTNLLAYKFDFIAVSPWWRTRHTILPYLQATGRTVEIWPELFETKTFNSGTNSLAPELVTGTKPFNLPPVEEQSVFKLRTDPAGSRYLQATNWAGAVGLAKQTMDLLRARFGTNDTTVLLVGHGTAGATLIRYLTRDPAWSGWLQNAKLWMAQEQPDGKFELRLLNGAPYPPQR